MNGDWICDDCAEGGEAGHRTCKANNGWPFSVHEGGGQACKCYRSNHPHQTYMGVRYESAGAPANPPGMGVSWP